MRGLLRALLGKLRPKKRGIDAQARWAEVARRINEGG